VLPDTPRLSRRLTFDPPLTRLAAAVAARRARGEETLDLTVANPTQVGLRYPDAELAEALARGAAAPYRPEPRGLLSAREALAAALSTPDDPVSPDDLLLTASTSEAYAFLFKLLADPGDEVLTPVPSYPLLDELAALEGVRLGHFPLEPGRSGPRFALRFDLEPDALERAITPASRALVVVHPGNPTGAYLSPAEQEAAAAICAARGLALVSDEVFADYPLSDAPRAGPAAARSDLLAISLGGLSKGAGLPSWKLGWIRAGGPPAPRCAALAALERIADSYLSVATPVQEALPEVLRLAPRIRRAIAGRTAGNLGHLAAVVAAQPALELVPPEGGWAAVLRIPRLAPDEEVALALLEETGVLVHPGYLFDFPDDGYLVLSLLPEPGRFAAGVDRLTAFLAGRLGQ
jgi:alanine-synthesizing transaminase